MLPRCAYGGHKQPVVQDYDPDPAPYLSKPRGPQAECERRLRTSLLPQGVSVAAAVPAWPKARRAAWIQAGGVLKLLALLAAAAMLGYTALLREPPESGPPPELLLPSEIAQGESQVLAAQRAAQQEGAAQPRVAWQEDTRTLPARRIPRIVHQTYKIAEPPVETLEYMQSWRDVNVGYQFHFYDDESCLEFVRTEFPEYFDAYIGLPKVGEGVALAVAIAETAILEKNAPLKAV